MAALQFSLHSGYLKAQRKKLSPFLLFFWSCFHILQQCLFIACLPSLPLSWIKMKYVLNHPKYQPPPYTAVISELKNRNCQEITCFFLTLCCADAEKRLGEESSISFTSGISFIYQYSPCSFAMVCRTTIPVLRDWTGSTALILPHPYWHAFLYYN